MVTANVREMAWHKTTGERTKWGEEEAAQHLRHIKAAHQYDADKFGLCPQHS